MDQSESLSLISGQEQPTLHGAEKTKDSLLCSAKELFAERGFNGTTVREIAQKAGVNISLVSYHFDGKEGLYRACIEAFGKRRAEGAERTLKTPKDAEEFKKLLRSYLYQFVEDYFSDVHLSRIIFSEMNRGFDQSDEIWKPFVVAVKQLENFFSSSKETGLIRADLDPNVLVALLLSTFITLIEKEAVSKAVTGVSVNDQRDIVIDHVLQIASDGVLV